MKTLAFKVAKSNKDKVFSTSHKNIIFYLFFILFFSDTDVLLII